MQIYNYDIETGEIISEQTARIDPLESIKTGHDVFLIPAYATDVQPPSHLAGSARCFVNGSWAYIEDHRGTTVYRKDNLAEHIIRDLGPIPADYTTLEPGIDSKWNGTAWAVDFVLRQQRITALMQAYMDEKAQAYGYDNILSAKSYVTSTNATWRAEGEAFRDWQDAVWEIGITILAAIEAGTSTITTEEALIAELPPFPLDS